NALMGGFEQGLTEKVPSIRQGFSDAADALMGGFVDGLQGKEGQVTNALIELGKSVLKEVNRLAGDVEFRWNSMMGKLIVPDGKDASSLLKAPPTGTPSDSAMVYLPETVILPPEQAKIVQEQERSSFLGGLSFFHALSKIAQQLPA